jgi:hypothetical protein
LAGVRVRDRGGHDERYRGRAIALHRDRVTDPDGAGKLCREVRWQVNLRAVCQDDTIEFTDRG